MPETNCPFCELPAARVVLTSAYFNVIRDGYPISPGHTLVIPKRHVRSLFELLPIEFAELQGVLGQVRQNLDMEFKPDGFNLGINDGPVAGQTVPHLHVHVIPRYLGDKADPRGGIRWLFPEKADYWSAKA